MIVTLLLHSVLGSSFIHLKFTILNGYKIKKIADFFVVFYYGKANSSKSVLGFCYNTL